MEAKPVCKFCKRAFDPSDYEAQAEHRARCLGAAIEVTVGGKSPHPPGTVTQTKFYRPKRRKKSDFKS